jgi:hypothetical protein
MSKPKPTKAQTSATAPKPRNRPDWELIENEYRINQLTVRQMADKHGVNKTTITDRAKKHGWTRDLQAAVKLATRAQLVQAEADKHGQNTDTAVQIAATTNRQIIEQHRLDIADTRALAAELRTELRKAAQLHAVSDELITAAAQSGTLSIAELGVFIKNLRNAFDLPSRVGMIKALAETITKTVTIERQAFGLDEEGGKPPVDPKDLEKMSPMDAIKLMVAATQQ